jgi:hypothetical protein
VASAGSGGGRRVRQRGCQRAALGPARCPAVATKVAGGLWDARGALGEPATPVAAALPPAQAALSHGPRRPGWAGAAAGARIAI